MNLGRFTLVAIAGFWLSAAPLFAQATGIFADISTSLGTFTVQLDYGRAPRTVANFIGLATGAQPWLDPETGAYRTNQGFYQGTAVHLINYDDVTTPGTTNRLGFRSGLRAVRNAAGTAAWTGGPGYTILDEATNGLTHAAGTIAMVHSAPHTGASEFVVTATNCAVFWDGLQTVFGLVVSNMATVTTISQVAMSNGFPLAPVAVSNIAIRRVGAAAEAFDIAAWNLPQVAESDTELIVGNGTNLSSIAYDVPGKSQYFIAHTTNLAMPSWSINPIGFHSQTQAIRVTNSFLAQPGAFGPVHFFHSVQSRYSVFSAIELGSGVQFKVQWTDGTVYQYYLDLRGAWGSCTGMWVAKTGEVVTGSGTISGIRWQTRTANTTQFNFMDNLGNVTDYTLGFEAPGAGMGRYYMDIYSFLGDPLGYEFGLCQYAPWTPGTRALPDRSTAASSGAPIAGWTGPACGMSDWPLRSTRAPTGATRAPGCRPLR